MRSTPSAFWLLSSFLALGCGESTNVGVDGGGPRDASTPDASRPLACSGAAYVGDPSFDGVLAVQDGAALCARPPSAIVYGALDEKEQAVRDAIAAAIAGRSVATVGAGEHPLPLADTTFDLGLPICVQDGVASAVAATAATSATVTTVEEGGFGTAPGHHVDATLGLGAGTLTLAVTLGLASDAASLGPGAAADHRAITLRREDGRYYVPCGLAPTVCTDLALGALGTLHLEEYTWRDSPGLGFATAVRATGTVQGTTIDVHRYEQLTTVYGHHAFDRYTFVRFDAPIGGACGLRVDVDVSEVYVAALADCDGVPIASPVAVTANPVACP